MGAQVRLTDEVEQWLAQRCTESGRSLAAEADAWLRRAAGLPAGPKSPAAMQAARNHPAPLPPPAAVITPPQGRGAQSAVGRRPLGLPGPR